MYEDLKKKISMWFEDHKDEMLNDLAKLVSIKSIAGKPEGEYPFGKNSYDALCAAEEVANKFGLSTKKYDNACLSADLNERETALGMLCHVDVVQEGAGWDTDPYAMVEKNGALFGRGTSDDKGPAIASIYAMAAAKAICPDLTKNCRLILGSSEETGAGDLVYYEKYDKYPEAVFSPDSDFPLVNIEKGKFGPFFSADWVESRTLPRIVSIKGGTVSNIIPRQTTAEIEGLKSKDCSDVCRNITNDFGGTIDLIDTEKGVLITCTGTAAHASTPELGLNSTTLLITALLRLPIAECDGLYRLRSLCSIVPHGDYSGKSLGIACSDDLSGQLTVNFGVFEYRLTGMSGNLDIRTPICADTIPIEAITLSAFGKHGIYCYTDNISKSHCVPADSPLVKTLLDIYTDYTGEEGKALAIGGITYAHNIPGGVAFGCTMPGHDACIHGANEHILLSELMTSAEMFTKAIIDICK